MTDYATLAELKNRLRLTGTSDDVELQQKLDAARGRINDDCGRTFDAADVSASQREYTITHERKLLVDDFATTTSLAVALGSATGSAVASTAFRVKPDNAIVKGRAAWLLEARQDLFFWPLTGVSAFVTAKWGWPAVPDPIHEACLLLAQRLFRRKDSSEGVAGSNDMGLIRIVATDPDYRALIDGYIRPEV